MIISKPQTDRSSTGSEHGCLTSQTARGRGLPIPGMPGRACARLLCTSQLVGSAAARGQFGYYGHVLKRAVIMTSNYVQFCLPS